jgi:4-hydroxy-3-methylbut-2-enyl diphosphate reductase
LTIRRLICYRKNVDKMSKMNEKQWQMNHPSKILLAKPRGFCAGVGRAIDVMELALAACEEPIYVRKEIVHNRHVVNSLRARGVIFVNEINEIPEGAVAIFSAHGVSPQVRREAADRGLKVVDATCPLVTKVHLEAIRFAREGRSIILIGHKGHEEVEGTMGEAPDDIRLVGTVGEAEAVEVERPDHVAVITQTTLGVDDVNAIIDVLRRRFPTLVTPSSDDICYATQNRQTAVKAMAERADLVLVLGSQNSSNSKRLQEVAQMAGAHARLIEDVSEIEMAWLTGVRTIAISAGASAPEYLVQQVVDFFQSLGPVEVEEVETIQERVAFAPPPEIIRIGASRDALEKPLGVA